MVEWDKIKNTNPFPLPSYSEWKKLVDFEKLKTLTYEGIQLDPLYVGEGEGEEGSPTLPLFSGRSGQEIASELTLFPKGLLETRKALMSDFRGGVRSFFLNVPHPESLKSLEDWKFLLDEIPFGDPQIPIKFFWKGGIGGEENEIQGKFLAYCEKRGISPEDRRGGFIFDPLGDLALGGERMPSLSSVMKKAEELALWIKRPFPLMTCLHIQGQVYHHAGANETCDLAFALSTGLYYLRFLVKLGLSLQEATQLLCFHFALGPDLFPSVAKLRAFPLLWRRILEVCDPLGEMVADPRSYPPVYVKTSERVLTKRDPWVNILRSTLVGMAGQMGGATGVILPPFDEPLNTREDVPLRTLSRRLSRNTQWLLQKEALLGHILDPGRGSYFLEALTEEMASKAWEIFREVENMGGMDHALKEGWVYRKVQETVQERKRNLGTGRDPITGVSEFPHLEEKVEGLKGQEVPGAAGPAKKNDPETRGKKAKTGWKSPPLVLQRWSEPFEVLRDKSDAWLEKKGERPQVILLSVGKVSPYIERINFMKNFLEVGGFHSVSWEISEAEAAVPEGPFRSFVEGWQPDFAVVALCTSEALLDQWGEKLIPSLKKALAEKGKRTTLLVAGRAKDSQGNPRNWGVDHFVHKGAAALEILQKLWERWEEK